MNLDEMSALTQTGESETLEFKSTTETRRARRFVQDAAVQADDRRYPRRHLDLSTG